MRRRFADNVAVVTGAGSGVGRATALRLASEGAQLALIGRTAEALAAVADEIRDLGGQAVCIPVDVSREQRVATGARQIAEEFGHVDLLVNAAGVLKLGAVPTFSGTDWDSVFDVNAKGCFLTSRALIPFMRGPGSAIVNVASVFAFAAAKGAAVYAASKAAVVALTQAMALDHIAEGIRINAVAPGSMATSMLNKVVECNAPDNPVAALEAIARMHPTHELVEADDVAGLILYLLSAEARSIVGTTCVIDGGRLAKLGAAD